MYIMLWSHFSLCCVSLVTIPMVLLLPVGTAIDLANTLDFVCTISARVLKKFIQKKIYSCGVCVCVGLKAHKVQYQGMFPVDLYYPLLLRHRAILLSYTITFRFSIRIRHYSIQKLPKSSNEKNKNVKSQKKKKCSSLRLKCARAPVLQPSPTHFIHFPPFVLSYLCLCDPPCRVGILVQAKLSSCAWTSPYLRLVIFPSTYTHFFKFSHKKMRCFLCRQRKWRNCTSRG
jgi:hypothetical protein